MWTSAHVAQRSGVLTGRTGSGECGGAHGTTSRITKTVDRLTSAPRRSLSGRIRIREVPSGRLTHLCELGAQDHLMRVWAGAIRGTRELFGAPAPNAPAFVRRSAHPDAGDVGHAGYAGGAGAAAGAAASRQHSPVRSIR